MKVVRAPRWGTDEVTFARVEVLVEKSAAEAGTRMGENGGLAVEGWEAWERQRQQG